MACTGYYVCLDCLHTYETLTDLTAHRGPGGCDDLGETVISAAEAETRFLGAAP